MVHFGPLLRLLASLGHPSSFQWLSRLGSVTARQSGSGRQPNFAALNRGRHLYSAGRPSRWALADIIVLCCFFFLFSSFFLRLISAVAELVRPSGRGTVHSRPHKIFLHFHDLWALLNKIREGVALSPLSILHKTINIKISCRHYLKFYFFLISL